MFFLFSFWHPYNSDVGTFQDVLEVPKPLLIFLNSCFFILFWFDVSFFLLVHTIDLSPVSFASLLVPCTFSFVSLSIGFIFSSGFQTDSTNSVSILITTVLNCASDRLSISLSVSCIFSGALKRSVIWAIFFLSWQGCHFKGRSLRCSPGWGKAGCCTVTLYVGEGPRGSNGARCTLHWISVFHSTTHYQTVPLWCWFPSGWACAHSRPLWVSPTTFPMRLGVSPAAAPTPMGIFNQRFEALFPRSGALGCAICFAPRCLSHLSVRKCGTPGCYPPLCLPCSPPR